MHLVRASVCASVSYGLILEFKGVEKMMSTFPRKVSKLCANFESKAVKDVRVARPGYTRTDRHILLILLITSVGLKFAIRPCGECVKCNNVSVT